MPPAEAAAIVVVPSLVTNFWQCAAGARLAALTKRFATALVALCAGVWLAAGAISGAGAGTAAALLGASLLVYALFGLASVRMHVPARAEPWLSPAMGLATGVVTAATGNFVVPMVPYLQSLGLGKEDLVQALGLFFTVATIALGAALAHDGVLDAKVAGTSLVALAPALAGMWIGTRVRHAIDAQTFRRWFFIGLLLLGAHLASKPLY